MKTTKQRIEVAQGAFKLRDACRYVGGVSQITLSRQIEKGNIKPCVNLRHLLIPRSELDRWLAEGQAMGSPASQNAILRDPEHARAIL